MDSINLFESQLLYDTVTGVWQNPHDDSQFTIKPARMNSINGSLRYLYSPMGNYRLPTSDRRYVVYETGQSSPAIIGIDTVILEWVRLDKLALTNELVIHVHSKQRILPLSAVYVMINNKKDLIFAVDTKICKQFLSRENPLYIHVYSNNWLSEEGQNISTPVSEVSAYIDQISKAGPVITEYYKPLVGNRFLFHNGYYTNGISIPEITLGDTLSVLNDKTGRGYFDLEINDLRHFHSTVDSRGKIIVQMPDSISSSPLSIEYGDELDIFICAVVSPVGTQERIKGFYYSKISSSDLRMLTHRDFSLDAQRIEELIDEHSNIIDESTSPFLRIFYRNHTDTIRTANDSIFLKDMFRVDADSRLHLMTDVAGTYEEWKAENLEANSLNALESSTAGTISLDSLKGIYSLEELNSRLRTGILRDNLYLLPEVMHLGGKVLCFDNIGKLISIIDVNTNMEYSNIVVPDETVSVECIPGTFGTTGDDFDRNTFFLDQASYFDEKYYWRGVGDTEWKEAYEGIDYHIDVDTGAITWDEIHNNTDARMKRSLKDAIYRRFVIEPEELYHELSIYEGDGPVTLLPLSRTDLFINGRRCIEGIDYMVDYPKITICNKQYYIDEGDADIVVDLFHHGVPGNPGTKPLFGFVRNGRMTDTNPDIFFENRNMSLSIDGYRAEFSEAGLYENPNSLTNSKFREGALYGAEAWPYCLGPWGRKRLFNNTYTAALAASGSVSKLIQQPSLPSTVFIPHAHALYSPFLKRMLVRLRDETIDVRILGTSEAAVSLTIEPYIDELNNDIMSLNLDYGMIDIHPTPNMVQVDITEIEEMFLRTISNSYMEGRVVFNAYTNIQDETPPHEG